MSKQAARRDDRNQVGRKTDGGGTKDKALGDAYVTGKTHMSQAVLDRGQQCKVNRTAERKEVGQIEGNRWMDVVEAEDNNANRHGKEAPSAPKAHSAL